MTDYTRLYDLLLETKAASWVPKIKELTDIAFSNQKHGNFDLWAEIINSFPNDNKSLPTLNNGFVQFGGEKDFGDELAGELTKKLKEFMPWRKGPFSLCNINIDTEWRSDIKWERLKGKISSLEDRTILDIGCGNGYHLWRMYLEGAKIAFGIDPYLLSVMQFNIIERFSEDLPVFVSPVGVDDMPDNLDAFDTVFSMGLLYHRREPLEHIKKLFGTVSSGGEVVLETLILDSQDEEIFVPEGRYAKMRNVWNLPSPSQIIKWMKSSGFKNVECVDITVTTPEEQRVTDWMEYESLANFLDPNDSSKTIEGHQAPIRAIFVGEK